MNETLKDLREKRKADPLALTNKQLMDTVKYVEDKLQSKENLMFVEVTRLRGGGKFLDIKEYKKGVGENEGNGRRRRRRPR